MKRYETMREPKSTLANELYLDCLQKVLSFGKPLDIWRNRLVSSAWHQAVPVALLQVHSASIYDNDEHDIHRIIANICPNLSLVSDVNGMQQVKYLVFYGKKFSQAQLCITRFFFLN